MILHIDMDAFFASVEQRDNPDLRGKPVIVGGVSGRGVVCSASYEARKSGVKSAMPVFEARKLCPGAIFVPPDKDKYGLASRMIMKDLYGFSPVVEQVSVDEAFLDISGLERLFGSPYEIGTKIKKEILEKEGLTCSIGISPVRFLSKIASDMRKPDGLFIIKNEEVHDFIRNLPLSKVPGVGGKTLETLSIMGLSTLGDLKNTDKRIIIRKLGLHGERLIGLSMGIDDPVSGSVSKNHSVSKEITLENDVTDRDFLKKAIMAEVDDICRELRDKRLKGRTVTIKIKTKDFSQITRSKTLASAMNCTRTAYLTACRLLDEYEINTAIRLIGVSVSNLGPEDAPVQGLLFKDKKEPDAKWSKIDRALDRISDRFGDAAVSPAFIADRNK